jgi:small-conductance mechanosensitive channel
MTDLMKYNIIELENFKLSVLSLLIVICILVITPLILFLIKRIILRRVLKDKVDRSRQLSIFQIFKYFIWIFSITLIFETTGIKLTFLLAGSAALLVGIGLGLQQVFSDFISGVIILFDGSIKVNDVMEVDGIVGRVEAINLRTATLQTRNGYSIIIPNHKFLQDNVVNWSYNNQTTRFNILVGADYNSDEELVKSILLECANEHPRVICNDEFPTIARLRNFGDHALEFELLFWSNDTFPIENIKSDIRYSILRKFRANKITIPYPQRDIHIKSDQTKG